MKRKIYNLYLLLRSIPRADELFLSFKSMFDERVYSNKKHLKMAGEWLLKMQNKDGGYARKYSLAFGKDKSYIETTGYIIPSLFALSDFLKDKRFKESAIKASNWLLSVQNKDGSFSEIDNNRAFAFDTGQVLIGLNFIYKKTKDPKFLEAIKKASIWLVENQEEDGSWEKVAYNSQKHTYYTRVAAALFEAGEILEDQKFKLAALKMIEWSLKNQLSNGFFKHSSFLEKTPPFLHTIIYVLEGLLDIYEYTKDPKILNAILKSTETLKNINLKRDLLLCSEYDENFNCLNRERCTTGLAQWAGVALRVYEITKDDAYKNLAVSTLFYLKAKQLKVGKNLKGSLLASIPFWGKYGSFDLVNWGVKFFIDALLAEEKLSLKPREEQEIWVAQCFLKTEVVSTNLTPKDQKYLDEFKKSFKDLKSKKIRVLDLGCGRGKLLEELEKNYPNWEIFGVDPLFWTQKANIKRGSAYKIPFKDEYFDIILSVEVLQHTYLDFALKEIKRALKKDGFLVIGERNPFSILGVLKPFFELRGKWMYPWDSPFREKWLSKNRWKKILSKTGFRNCKILTIEGDGKKFVNRYFFIKAQI